MRPPPLHYSQTWITSWLFLLLESNLYVLIHGILYGHPEFTHVSARASID